MTPDERASLDAIIGQILDTVAREKGVAREWLSLEIEQVVSRAVFEAHRIGQTRRRPSQTIPIVREEK